MIKNNDKKTPVCHSTWSTVFCDTVQDDTDYSTGDGSEREKEMTGFCTAG